VDLEQTVFNNENGELIFKKEIVKCSFCKKDIELNKKNFHHANLITPIEKRLEEINKMKRQKHETEGNFLKTEDIGDEVGDRITVKILGEGELKQVTFADGNEQERLEIPVEVEGESKSFGLSPTNENVLIDKFGDESAEWVNKEFTAVLQKSNVGKSGFYIAIRKKD